MGLRDHESHPAHDTGYRHAQARRVRGRARHASAESPTLEAERRRVRRGDIVPRGTREDGSGCARLAARNVRRGADIRPAEPERPKCELLLRSDVGGVRSATGRGLELRVLAWGCPAWARVKTIPC